MSLITWALILTGVGLNAAAQLLLKVRRGRSRIFRLQCLHFEQQHPDPVQEPAVLGRHGVLRRQCVCLARRAVQGAGEHGLSHALVRVRGGRGRCRYCGWGRPLNLAKVAGIALICAGVILVSRSSV